MEGRRSRCSRFEVLSEGAPAWAIERGRVYQFDGLRFWVLRSGYRKLTVSWRTPKHGWFPMQMDECPVLVLTEATSRSRLVA